jgi:uncharacterized protein (TIGR03545 family)
MTNSTNSTPPANTPLSKPKRKAKGPIRTGVVVPTLILIVLLGVYFNLFFDGHIRRAMEYMGTQIIGAEVNVARVNTSFLGASLEVGGIQVTDKEHPERNLVQVGAIKFKMLWDALLRAKVVVDEASILDIQAYTPRKHPGYVLPPEPPPKDDGQPSAIEKVQSEVLAQTRKKYNDNFLGDIAGVLGSSDPKTQLKNLEQSLKSEAKIKMLEKEINEKKLAWEKRIKELPQGKDLDQYKARVKALKFDIKNPGEFAKNVKEADKIIKEANEKVKDIDKAQKELKSDVGTYSLAYKDLEKLVQDDLRDLQSKLKIPSIDPKEFSQQLFMTMIEKKLGSLYKYIEVARKYMPPKKTAAEKQAEKDEQIIPPKRGQGKNFTFPITTGYPLFWLKHAAISSEMNTSEFSGNIKGEIKDLTSSPSVLGRPTLILVQGDFPKQNIQGLDAKITLDHTTDVAKESLSLKVAAFPVTGAKLADSPDVKLSLDKADGSSDVQAVFTNNELTMNMRNTFANAKFGLESKQKLVTEIVGAVLNGIPTVNVNANVKGSLSDLDIHINSNLGDELSKGFQKQLQAKINEAKAQLQKLIDEKISAPREKLKADINKLTGDLTKQVDGKKAEGEKAIKDAQNQVKSGSSGSKDKLKDEGKKLLNKFMGG